LSAPAAETIDDLPITVLLSPVVKLLVPVLQAKEPIIILFAPSVK